MDKQLIAARMNSQDDIAVVLQTGTKAPSQPKSNKTYKLVESIPDDIYLIFNPNNQVIASIMKGSGNNWQLVSADFSTIVNYKARPSLEQCMFELR